MSCYSSTTSERRERDGGTSGGSARHTPLFRGGAPAANQLLDEGRAWREGRDVTQQVKTFRILYTHTYGFFLS